MPVNWYVDEGLRQLSDEWKREYPGAVVYFIGDSAHSKDPDVSQHAPDDGGPQPGDDKGEVDAGDFMPGKGGVTERDLDALYEGLVRSRDPRILYVIYKRKIVSSTVQPWVERTYGGNYHGHVHVSVNDKYDSNTSDWKWEPEVARTVKMVEVDGKLPELRLGDDDDVLPGYNGIIRAQTLANLLDGTIADIDVDGVYGPNTARKIGKAVKASGPVNTLTNSVWYTLLGITR